MLSLKCPKHSHLELVWPENKNTVNLKIASFVIIMLLHKGLTHIHSQKSLGCILARVNGWFNPNQTACEQQMCNIPDGNIHCNGYVDIGSLWQLTNSVI